MIVDSNHLKVAHGSFLYKLVHIFYDFILSFMLLILFYLVITPTGLLLRIFGKDYILRKIDKKIHSYWMAHKQA